MADQDFVVRLVLEGADLFKSQVRDAFQQGSISALEMAEHFQEIERHANRAIDGFRNVQSAARTMRTAFTEVVASGTRVVDAYNKLETAGTKFVRNTTLLTAGVTGAVTALTAFVASGVKAADALADQAAAANLTTDRYQDLSLAAAAAGVSQRQLATGLTQFNRLVANSAREQAKTLSDFVDRVGSIKFPGLIEIGPAFADTQKKIREGALKVQADMRALGKNVSLATVTEELTKLANGGAKAREEFERLTGSTLTTGNKAFDDLRAQAEGGRRSLQQLGVTLKRTESGSLDTEAAILDVADAFSKMADGPEKTAFAIEFFGRNVGPKLIPFLNQGREGIAGFSKELADLKLTAAEVKIGDRVSKELDLLGFAAEKTKDKIALVFAPSLEFGVNTLRSLITQNQVAILDFARAIQAQVFPHVKAFFDLLAGRQNLSEAGENMQRLKEIAISFGTAVKSAVVDVIIPAFGFLMRVLDQVATLINSVFGTNITGQALAVALVLAKITGAFGLLTAAVGLARAAFGFLFTLFTRFAAVVGWPVALAAALATLALRFESVQRVAQALQNALRSLFGIDISGSALVVGLTALAAGLLAARTRAVGARGALAAVAKSPLARFLGVAGVALALFGDKLFGAGEAADKTGDKVDAAGKKIDAGSKHIIDLRKQLGEKTPDSLSTGITQVGDSSKKAAEEVTKSGGIIDRVVDNLAKELDKPLEIKIRPGSVVDVLTRPNPSVENARKALQESEDNVVSSMFQADQKIRDGVDATINAVTTAWTSFFDWLTGKQQEVAAQPAALSDRAGAAAPPVPVTTDAGGGSTLDTITQGADAAKQKIDALKLSVQQLGPIVAGATGVEFEQARAKLISISDSAETLVQKFRDGVQPTFVNTRTLTENLGAAVLSITPSAEELVKQFQKTQQATKGVGQGLNAVEGEVKDVQQVVQVGFDEPLTDATTGFEEASGEMVGFMDAVSESVNGAIAKMNELAAAAERAAAAAAKAAASGGGGGGGGDSGGGDEEFASGGMVRGRGGIDTIPAWLTNREFVMRASAVRKYGAAFMSAINEGRLQMPRFNLGGLVGQLSHVGAPRFANGGSVNVGGGSGGGAETTVWIGVPGVGRFGPMRAPADVAEQMRRASVISQMASGGRTPRGG